MEPYTDDLNKVLNKYEFQLMPKKDFVYQEPRQLLLRNFISKNTLYDNILLYHELGVGKCHALNTPILMYSGEIKMVQDIRVGDLLMGDDSTPRKVMSLANGQDKMYDIIPIKGEHYTVNEEHILCLKASGYPSLRLSEHNNNYNVQWIANNKINSKTFTYNDLTKDEKKMDAEKFLQTIKNEQVIEISVRDYLKLPESRKAILKGYRHSVEFKETPLPIDPYMIGYWLGDGSQGESLMKTSLDDKIPVITSQDAVVLKYFNDNLKQYDVSLNYQSNYNYRISGGSGKYGSNKFLTALKELNLINNKHIPHIYKCNSRENRLKLLAGLLDADGHLHKSKSGYEFTQSLEHEQIINDIIYLARSLGFACYKNKKKTSWTYKGVKEYGEAWRISIFGNGIEEIPVLCPRKKANQRRQIKDVLVTGIKVNYSGEDNYYGFTLDGNSRYLMGDFTVTHNTCTSISIAEGFKEYLSDMNRKILVLVKNDNLKKNFVDELFKTGCSRNAYFDEELKREYNTANAQRREEILNKVIRRINKVYQFMTYGTFANAVFGVKQYITKIEENVERKFIGRKEATITDLNNTVIIIDEVHNVTNNIYYKAIMEVLKRSYNYRLVLLTATPMYDNVTEIFEISNLLNANNPANILPIKDRLFKENILTKIQAGNLGLLNTNQIDITEHGMSLLKKSLYGKVSYFAADTKTFPKKIDMGTPLIPDLKFSINIIECEMSEYQTQVYREALMSDKNIFEEFDVSEIANKIESSDEIKEDSSSMFHNSSSASTLVYPNNMYGEKGFLSCFDLKRRKGVESYSIKPEFSQILQFDGELQKYSSKLHSLLTNVKTFENEPGLVFIFSNYVRFNGAELLRQLFTENGYTEFKNEASSIDQKTFVIFDSRFNSTQRKTILNLFNNPKNKNGEFIKIIIGSPIISEGITLKNTRQVHILEPSWNMSRINQIIGRAVRFKSHELLDPTYRNVQVFKYVSVAEKQTPQLESIDKQKYILSEYKDRSNKTIERTLKEIAIDCDINVRKAAAGSDRVDGSAECDYTTCDYKCDIKPIDKLDKSTYKLYLDFYDKFDIEYAISIIKKLFNDYFVWSLGDIISRIRGVSIESIYYAVNSLIENKVLISDTFGRDGFLIQKEDYIIFNPIDKDISTSLFAKTLDFQNNVNKYTLDEYLQIQDLAPVEESESKIKKKKIGVDLPDEDVKFNDNMIREHDIFGTYRAEGIDGKFGPVDNFFRIVDLREFRRDLESDNRKIPTGMRITSKKIKDLKDLIKYFKISKEYIKKTVGDIDKLKQRDLAIIMEKYFKEHNLILR